MTNLATIHPEQSADTLMFLEALSCGRGQLKSALSVGWSPHKLRTLMKNPEFIELMDEARVMSIETIEERVYDLADRGNLAAATLVLYCQAADRGWRPPAQRVAVSTQSTVKIELVEGAKAAVMEQLRAGDIKALQPGGALDIEDAEVVDP